MRLEQAEYQARKKSSSGTFIQSQKQAHSTMVSGIEARSSNALKLESRNFRKEENGWAALEKGQERILQNLDNFLPLIKALADSGTNLSKNVMAM